MKLFWNVVAAISCLFPGMATCSAPTAHCWQLSTTQRRGTGDHFGNRVAILGKNRVLLGASGDNSDADDAGSAYVFSSSGNLPVTVTNPAPAAGDWFGARVVAIGNERALIGATLDDTGANGAGSAYLYNIPAPASTPPLTIWRTTTNTVVISWPSPSAGFELQQHTNGLRSANWSDITYGLLDHGTNKTLIVSPTNHSGYYRLIAP